MTRFAALQRQSNWRVSRLKPCRRSHRRQQGNYLFSRKRFRSRRSHLMVLQVTGTIAFLTHPYSVIRSLGMANLPKCGKGLQRPKSSIPKPWKNAYDSFPKTPLRPRWRVTDVKWNDGVGISKSRLLWLPAPISAFGRSEAFLAAVPMTGIAAVPTCEDQPIQADSKSSTVGKKLSMARVSPTNAVVRHARVNLTTSPVQCAKAACSAV